MPIRPTIIIADTSSMFRMYFSTLLTRMNFDVLPVENAADVLSLARVVRPSLLTLDTTMGENCGIAILRQLRNDPTLRHTPVLMVSASAIAEAECREVGCSDFLTKPVDLKKLYSALQEYQPNHQSQRQHLRVPVNRRVTCRAGQTTLDCFAVTLSEGGVYLRLDKPLPVGTRVEIDLPLAKRELMLVGGEVIYTKEQNRGVFSLPPGMAIRFDGLDQNAQERLTSEVALLLAGDIAAAQPEPVVRIG